MLRRALMIILSTVMLATSASSLFVVAGCGQKGPLILPPPVAAPQTKAVDRPPPSERPADRPFPGVPPATENK